MVLWPLAVGTAGLVGLNWQASRDLAGAGELQTSSARKLQPWLLFLLGAATGLWAGVTWAPQIKKACAVAEVLLRSPEEEDADDERTDSEDDDERHSRRKKKSRRS